MKNEKKKITVTEAAVTGAKIRRNAVELSDNELAEVSGGTFYDARCTKCGGTLCGAGGAETFTLEYKKKLAAKYDNEFGCPFCGAKGEGTFELISAETIEDLVSGISITVLKPGVDY